MNRQQFEDLKNLPPGGVRHFSVDNLEDKSDRALLYGYTCDRDTWHVYLYQGEINLFVYAGSGKHTHEVKAHVKGVRMESESLIPDKRLYPQCCDYETCRFLDQQGIYLPFTTFDDAVAANPFHGKLYQQESSGN